MSGGRTDVIDQVTRHVYIYDSATDAWTPLPDMNTTRSDRYNRYMKGEPWSLNFLFSFSEDLTTAAG